MARTKSGAKRRENDEPQEKKKRKEVLYARTNMVWGREPVVSPSLEEFDWSAYEDGWNGRGLNPNTRVNAKSGDKVYCHESYAKDLYDKMNGVVISGNKEIAKNTLVSISDIRLVDNDTIMLTVNDGANNVIVDLNKEDKFFNQLTYTEGNETKAMTKETFVKAIGVPTFKQSLLSMNLNAKVGSSVEKASIWDGYVENLTNELKEQITANSKAYYATILSTNRGGFVVEIMDTIKAFMPGSMAAANRVTDFESMVGKRMEVMIESMIDSWDPSIKFVVSRKKYIRTMLPYMIQQLKKKLEANKDTVFTGHVTGHTEFGIFVELDDFITGMLHKTLVRDETRELMKQNAIAPGTEVQVYVHKIEGNRVILSDVPSEEREAVIARREAEEN